MTQNRPLQGSPTFGAISVSLNYDQIRLEIAALHAGWHLVPCRGRHPNRNSNFVCRSKSLLFMQVGISFHVEVAIQIALLYAGSHFLAGRNRFSLCRLHLAFSCGNHQNCRSEILIFLPSKTHWVLHVTLIAQ